MTRVLEKERSLKDLTVLEQGRWAAEQAMVGLLDDGSSGLTAKVREAVRALSCAWRDKKREEAEHRIYHLRRLTAILVERLTPGAEITDEIHRSPTFLLDMATGLRAELEALVEILEYPPGARG